MHIGALTETLEAESFVAKPDRVATNAARAWNKLRDAIPGWPDIELEVPSKRVTWSFALDTFSSGFQADVERWLHRLANPDPFSDIGPVKPLQPATLEHRRYQIRQMASALVHQGHAREQITSLAYLVDLDHFKDGLRFMMSRSDDKPTEAIHGLAMGLKAVAEHHVRVTDTHLDAMRQICGRLNLNVDGLREKNRQRLMQFDDDDNLARLLHLPAELVNATRDPNQRPYRKALLVQAAMAIEILLYAPLRVGNLAALDIERHLRWIKVRREQRLLITLPPEEVKNKKPLSYELGPESAKLVQLYLDQWRPILLRSPSTYLFPARDGSHKPPQHVSGLIKRTIKSFTGLDVHAHLFRNLAGKLHVRMVPGDYGTLAQVLNDTLKTAMKSYAQFEQAAAVRHFQATIDTLRRQTVTGRKIRKAKK